MTTIRIEKEDLDNSIFSACEEAADKLAGQTRRQRLAFALSVSESIMLSVDQLQGKQERSARASKAAKARHAAPADPNAPPKPKRVRRTKAQIAADAMPKAWELATLPQPATPAAPAPVNNEEILPAPFGAGRTAVPAQEERI